MAYEMVMPYHLHMPSYFLETFTEYPYFMPVQAWAYTYVCVTLCISTRRATHIYV